MTPRKLGKSSISLIALSTSVGLSACQPAAVTPDPGTAEPVFVELPEAAQADPMAWPAIEPIPLDPEVEAWIDDILAQMTLEQKVGQTIQADSGSVTANEVREYRLGSVLSGGNSRAWAPALRRRTNLAGRRRCLFQCLAGHRRRRHRHSGHLGYRCCARARQSARRRRLPAQYRARRGQ